MPVMTVKLGDESYEFDPDRLRVSEAEAVERVMGTTFTEFGKLLEQGSAMALHAMVWLILRRETPSLKFGDVDFEFGDLTVETDEDEQPAKPDPTETASGAESASTSPSSPTGSGSDLGNGAS